MNLRGNPFVDVGLAIAANRGNQKSLSVVLPAHLSDAVKTLRSNMDGLKSLKGVLAAFWFNNPFMGQNLGQKEKYDRYLRDLGDRQLKEMPGYCQICGQSPVIGQTDRCWFPLAGSGNTDPCTLPGLRGKTVCATCLSAAVVLPLGCRFCREGPYFIHVAEPVRFNRGQSQGDDFDFKYMRGRDGKEYPYVSSQCYKRYWRESLPGPASPITRAKGAAGKEKNQAYTNGNPITYVDDDLFGYMIAGAAESEEEREVDLESLEADSKHLFEADNLKDAGAFRKKLLQSDSLLSEFVLKQSSDVQDILRSESQSGEAIQGAILQALNNAVESTDLITEQILNEVGIKGKMRTKFLEAKTEEEKRDANRTVLNKAFGKELQDKKKRPTTRRTAPVRMHALLAFSGIKTAKDFQTFSRDIVYTGKNSIVNPKPQGIYSAWLKTRILIESHRIGRFYIGENMELLEEQAKGQQIKEMQNPYSRDSDKLRFIEMNETERTRRLRAALKALADIGNKQGPASGALHDGSLRPKAFVAGMMTCADSPFDDVWKGGADEGIPFLDIAALVDIIKDWDDLFAMRKLYFGLPHDARTKLEETIKNELSTLKFDVVIDSPRKALLQLSEEAVL